MTSLQSGAIASSPVAPPGFDEDGPTMSSTQVGRTAATTRRPDNRLGGMTNQESMGPRFSFGLLRLICQQYATSSTPDAPPDPLYASSTSKRTRGARKASISTGRESLNQTQSREFSSEAGMGDLLDRGVTEEQFCRMLLELFGCPLDALPVMYRLFEVFDTNGNGYVSIRELYHSLGRATRGSVEERTDFFFDVFDLDNSETLDRHEVFQMLCLLSTRSDDGGATIAQAEQLMEMLDENTDDQVSREEFHHAVRRNPALLPFLAKIFGVAGLLAPLQTQELENRFQNALAGAAADNSPVPDTGAAYDSQTSDSVVMLGGAVDMASQRSIRAGTGSAPRTRRRSSVQSIALAQSLAADGVLPGAGVGAGIVPPLNLQAGSARWQGGAPTGGGNVAMTGSIVEPLTEEPVGAGETDTKDGGTESVPIEVRILQRSVQLSARQASDDRYIYGGSMTERQPRSPNHKHQYRPHPNTLRATQRMRDGCEVMARDKREMVAFMNHLKLDVQRKQQQQRLILQAAQTKQRMLERQARYQIRTRSMQPTQGGPFPTPPRHSHSMSMKPFPSTPIRPRGAGAGVLQSARKAMEGYKLERDAVPTSPSALRASLGNHKLSVQEFTIPGGRTRGENGLSGGEGLSTAWTDQAEVAVMHSTRILPPPRRVRASSEGVDVTDVIADEGGCMGVETGVQEANGTFLFSTYTATPRQDPRGEGEAKQESMPPVLYNPQPAAPRFRRVSRKHREVPLQVVVDSVLAEVPACLMSPLKPVYPAPPSIVPRSGQGMGGHARARSESTGDREGGMISGTNQSYDGTSHRLRSHTTAAPSPVAAKAGNGSTGRVMGLRLNGRQRAEQDANDVGVDKVYFPAIERALQAYDAKAAAAHVRPARLQPAFGLASPSISTPRRIRAAAAAASSSFTS